MRKLYAYSLPLLFALAACGGEDFSAANSDGSIDASTDIAADSHPDSSLDSSADSPKDSLSDLVSDSKAESSSDSSVDDGVASLDWPCSTQGLLACNGHAQKVKLSCNGSKWVNNGLCYSGEFCDTGSGSTRGTCQHAIAACLSLKPGSAVCNGPDRLVCGPDLVTSEIASCKSAEHCNQGSGASCAQCLTGEHLCVGIDLRVCDSLHQGFVSKSLCSAEGLCNAAAGVCDPPICKKGEFSCVVDDLRACAPDQSTWLQVQKCPVGLCDAPGKQCDLCSPNSSLCLNPTTRLICSADGQKQTSELCPATSPKCGASGQCQTCSTLRVDRTLKPLDFYLMVDRSGSLNGAAWSQLLSGLASFFHSPSSDGLSIALHFFPLDDKCDTQDYTCTGTLYSVPAVPWSVLPGASLALDQAFSTTDATGCLTPTQEALSGLLSGSKTRQLELPDHQVLAVLLSDGSPCCGDCPVESPGGLAQISGDFFLKPPYLRTYSVALASSAVETMSAIAQQGGGLVYKTDGSSAAVLAALNSLHGLDAPCEFAAPQSPPDIVNLSTLSVEYFPSGSPTGVSLSNVGSALQCGLQDGWYWDETQGEKKLVLCRASCVKMRGDLDSRLALSAETCPP